MSEIKVTPEMIEAVAREALSFGIAADYTDKILYTKLRNKLKNTWGIKI